MGIYSANRTGSPTGMVVENNANVYTSGDYGRILYECEYNDMLMFEAVMATDMNELQGLREGTILEAELKKLNKESLTSMKTKIIEGLKAFWAKIKGWFQDQKVKLAAYVARDCAKTASKFEAVKAKYEGEPVSVEYRKNKGYVVGDASSVKIHEIVADYVKDGAQGGIVSYGLGKLIGEKNCTPKEFRAHVFEKSFENSTLSSNDASDVVSYLKSAKAVIEGLKRAEMDAKKTIDGAIASIKEYDAANADKMMKYVNATQSIVTERSKVCMSVAQVTAKSYKAALTKLIAKMGGVKAMKEAAIEDAIESEIALDDLAPAEMSDDVKDIIDVVDAEAAAE